MIADVFPFLLVVIIIFCATFIRSAFGFGEALIAVPLLALLIPVKVAAPVAVLISITVAAIVVVQDWNYIHFRSATWLILASLLGTPVGLLLLIKLPGPIVKTLLATVIILFSAHSLLKRKQAVLKDDKMAGVFGFLAGILGGAYGMNGPPLVVFGTLRGWTPQHFRATLQGYFLPASIVVMIGYWYADLWTVTVNTYYLISFPAFLTAIFLGRAANLKMKRKSFLKYIHAGLIVVGCVLLWQSLL
ncbi:MAG: sulfite exporter TauE/SafE family protein [Balneolaceae bacterium]